ncbi:MAG: 50S ribosomal protein L11 methyltransferase, partial [Acetobacteraceae bacterium]|nr:50S ribosomal protein L11 methyltransferase [Acetobacteraceae bacterium]
MSHRHAPQFETVWVDVPENAGPAYESALSSVCETVGCFFLDPSARSWRVEGVKPVGEGCSELVAALALAALASGVAARLERAPVAAEGWL